MTTKEILETDEAIERAQEEFTRMQVWRWRTGKTKPCAMNAAKLAKCLQLEIGFGNEEYYFFKPSQCDKTGE